MPVLYKSLRVFTLPVKSYQTLTVVFSVNLLYCLQLSINVCILTFTVFKSPLYISACFPQRNVSVVCLCETSPEFCFNLFIVHLRLKFSLQRL